MYDIMPNCYDGDGHDYRNDIADDDEGEQVEQCIVRAVGVDDVPF